MMDRGPSDWLLKEATKILNDERFAEPTVKERLTSWLRPVHNAFLLLYEESPLLMLGAIIGLVVAVFGFWYASFPLLGIGLFQFIGCVFGLFVQICTWGADRPPHQPPRDQVDKHL